MLRGPDQQVFKLIFRWEVFNLLNRPNFANPSNDVSTPGTFGVISALTVNPRITQYALKLQFQDAASGTFSSRGPRCQNYYSELVQPWRRACRLSQRPPGMSWSPSGTAWTSRFRGWQRGDPAPVLAVALAEEQPSPQRLRRLEHEHSLASKLDPAWAAKPLALTRRAHRRS